MGKQAVRWGVFAVLAASRAHGAADEAAIQSTFVKPWMEALQSRDAARIEKFYHPQVRACSNAETKQFFAVVLDDELHAAAAGPYKVQKLALMGPPPAILPREGFSYPLQPTYELQVYLERSNLTLIRYLAPSNGSWFEDFPCPNDKGMAFLRAQQAEGAAQQRQARQLAAEVKDPLLSELKDLLGQQRKIDAIKRYREASGVDLSTAVSVIDVLQQPDR